MTPPIVLVAGAALAASFVLRVGYAFRHSVNTDEPQHLHVAWAWAQGLVPYREVFDHHMPLFHMLSAPLLALVGERADAVLWMRLAMIPCAALLLGATWVVARRLFGRESAFFAVALVALFPKLLLTSTQFRPDVLWAALAWTTLAILVSGRWTAGRVAIAGLSLGLALACSAKTVIFFCALVFGTVSTAKPMRVKPSLVLGASLAFALPSAVVAAAVSSLGGLEAMIEGVVRHNAGAPLAFLGSALSALCLTSTVLLARVARARFGDDLAFVGGTLGAFLSFLFTSSPLLSSQTALVLYPGAGILVAGLAGRWRPALRAPIATAICALEICVLTISRPVWQDHAWPETQLVAEVLALAEPAERVMDLKGESIFRLRAFRYPLEEVTLGKIAKGEISDTIPERLVDTRTTVARVDSPKFPPRARAFLNSNYVPVSPRTRVAGKHLTANAIDPGRAIRFTIGIPALYTFVTERGGARGSIDGEPHDGSRFLVPGEHVFVPAERSERLAVVWARAAERGFSPF